MSMQRLKLLKIINNSYFMLFFFFLLSCGLASFFQFDIKADFINYHYYNAFAFLNHRLDVDITPVGVWSFFNPIIEIPTYYLFQWFNDTPFIYYALQSIWGGLFLFMAYKIYGYFFDKTKISQLCYVFLALSIVLTSTPVFFQIGSSTNELTINFLNLCGIYMVLGMIIKPDTQKNSKFFISGLIMGIALGLKYTGYLYSISLGVSLVICYKYLKNPIKFISIFALAGFLGVLISNGYFMWRYWTLYDNPFFPFLNKIFKSPYLDTDFNFSDKRYIPELKKAFYYPFIWFEWSGKERGKIHDIEFYDVRFTVYYVCIWFVLLYGAIKRKYREWFNNYRLETFCFVFFVIGYFLWLFSIAIIRYTSAFEVFGALMLVKLLILFYPKNKAIKEIFYLTFSIILVMVLLLNAKFSEGFLNGNRADKVWAVEEINLPDKALVEVYGIEVSGLLPNMIQDKNITVIGRSFWGSYLGVVKGLSKHKGKFEELRQEKEKEYKGPVFILYDSGLLLWGFTDYINSDVFQGKACKAVKNNVKYPDMVLCAPEELEKDTFVERDIR